VSRIAFLKFLIAAKTTGAELDTLWGGYLDTLSPAELNELSNLPLDTWLPPQFVPVHPTTRDRLSLALKGKAYPDGAVIIPPQIQKGTKKIAVSPQNLKSATGQVGEYLQEYLRSGQTYPITIGRGPQSVVTVADDFTISTEHLVIQKTSDGLILTDFSRNGTMVNSETVSRREPRILHSGDTVQLGELSFTIPTATNNTLKITDLSNLTNTGTQIADYFRKNLKPGRAITLGRGTGNNIVLPPNSMTTSNEQLTISMDASKKIYVEGKNIFVQQTPDQNPTYFSEVKSVALQGAGNKISFPVSSDSVNRQWVTFTIPSNSILP